MCAQVYQYKNNIKEKTFKQRRYLFKKEVYQKHRLAFFTRVICTLRDKTLRKGSLKGIYCRLASKKKKSAQFK